MSIVGGLGGAAVRPSAEGVEVYFSPLGSSILLRTVEGTQESFLLRVPEDVPDCIGPSDGCGRPLPGSRIVDIALAPSGSMVFSLERCGALIEVDLDRGCTRSIVAPDMTPEDRQRMRIRSAQMEGQRLFVIGYEGLVLEAQWPQ